MTWWEPDGADPDDWRALVARPAILVVIAVLLSAGCLALLGWGAESVVSGREASSARVCSGSASAGCLSLHAIDRMSGRVAHRSLSQVWTVVPAEGETQVVDLSAVQAHRLNEARSRGAVQGLFWRGDLVAFRAADGTRISTDDYGVLAALFPVPWGLSLGGFAAGAWLSALARRRAGVGWWERRRQMPDTVPSWAVYLSVVIGLMGLVVAVPYEIGVPAWALGIVVVAGGGFLGWRTVRIARLTEDAPAGRHVA